MPNKLSRPLSEFPYCVTPEPAETTQEAERYDRHMATRVNIGNTCSAWEINIVKSHPMDERTSGFVY
ncbi:hypothetical protein Bpfe_018663 [Biomphalaria pfeifferi]|uniref:Uncharacterized protein n=1 Tax=Biomphalaria pfeifferi TaxID=112525 RepID=A0AAD8BDF6_BIOPF|nr:hypothetical protein Bpfe_018663 [Biomphalaria pfeifferi]